MFTAENAIRLTSANTRLHSAYFISALFAATEKNAQIMYYYASFDVFGSNREFRIAMKYAGYEIPGSNLGKFRNFLRHVASGALLLSLSISITFGYFSCKFTGYTKNLSNINHSCAEQMATGYPSHL